MLLSIKKLKSKFLDSKNSIFNLFLTKNVLNIKKNKTIQKNLYKHQFIFSNMIKW